MAGNIRIPAIKSFYTAREGLVTVEDDVLSIVRQVNELYDGRVEIQLDPVTGWFHFVENCEDGTERLIFSVQELDPRALDRLQKADGHWRGHTDPYLEAEQDQDRMIADKDRESMEKILAAGEGLGWALGDGKYGPGYKQSIRVAKDIHAHE